MLRLREGATENAAAVRALLADLAERGLATDRSLLIVIDGAKALHKAAVEVFGAQRPDLSAAASTKNAMSTDALPERLRGSIRNAMRSELTQRARP